MFNQKTELLASAISPEAALKKARTYLEKRGVTGDRIKAVERITQATIIR